MYIAGMCMALKPPSASLATLLILFLSPSLCTTMFLIFKLWVTSRRKKCLSDRRVVPSSLVPLSYSWRSQKRSLCVVQQFDIDRMELISFAVSKLPSTRILSTTDGLSFIDVVLKSILVEAHIFKWFRSYSQMSWELWLEGLVIVVAISSQSKQSFLA